MRVVRNVALAGELPEGGANQRTSGRSSRPVPGRLQVRAVRDLSFPVVGPGLLLARGNSPGEAHCSRCSGDWNGDSGHHADSPRCGGIQENPGQIRTICDKKGWTYNPDKDVCKALISTCQKNGLFPGFYDQILLTTAIVRNKLSSSHGRGPEPLYQVNKENAEHIIYITTAHIVLLIKFAGI